MSINLTKGMKKMRARAERKRPKVVEWKPVRWIKIRDGNKLHNTSVGSGTA